VYTVLVSCNGFKTVHFITPVILASKYNKNDKMRLTGIDQNTRQKFVIQNLMNQ